MRWYGTHGTPRDCFGEAREASKRLSVVLTLPLRDRLGLLRLVVAARPGHFVHRLPALQLTHGNVLRPRIVLSAPLLALAVETRERGRCERHGARRRRRFCRRRRLSHCRRVLRRLGSRAADRGRRIAALLRCPRSADRVERCAEEGRVRVEGDERAELRAARRAHAKAAQVARAVDEAQRKLELLEGDAAEAV